MTLRLGFIFCCLCLFAALRTSAQNANFTASPTSGCSPLTVTFTNTSTGFSSSATYEWKFGNGNSSAQENPGANYQDEGSYPVTLTVTDGGKSYSSQPVTITVYKKPVVDFSVDVTKGCSPLPVTFTSNSTPGDGTISSYTWDFGDGIAEKGNATQPHTYTVSKIISPSLTVTNSHGCYSTLSKPQLIQVLPSVYAAFKPNLTVLCSIQSPLTISNMTAGTGTISYNWDFGDNTTSNLAQPPQHIFTKPGTYPVKLTATSADGCSSDTTISISAADYHTDFSAPSPLCQSAEAVFEDISTPVPTSESWLINGSPFSDTVPGQLHHIFSAPGDYLVQLNTVFETCPSTTTKKVTVLPSPAPFPFIARTEGSCGAPVDVTFIDTAANADSWQWDFTGDGSATGSGQQTTFHYTTDSTYTVVLRRTNTKGCTVVITQPVVIGKTKVEIESSAGNLGCDSLRTVLSALSTDPVTQYEWDFGDGSTSTQATPEHLFASTGNKSFVVKLKYITQGGCSGEEKYTINIFGHPQFDFNAINGTSICGSTPVDFDVTGTNLQGTYYWNYGDSGRYVINSSPPFSHQYQHDSVFTVSLIIDNHGCRDTVTKENYLTVVPPFPHIATVKNTCDGDRGLVTFSDTSRKAISWSWDFGDNTPALFYQSARQNVQHQYGKSGHYIATLTTTNGICSAIDTANVYVLLKQQPLLSSDMTTFCSSETFRTSVSHLDNNPYTDTTLGYTITSVLYGNGTPFTGTLSLPDSVGQNGFGVNLVNVDPEQTQLRIVMQSEYFGCTDMTDYITFQALGPVAAFSLKENSICYKTPVLFTDKSRPTHNSPIVKWEWNFGDSTSLANITNKQVSHQYPEPGKYMAVLTVTDAKGCSASTSTEGDSITVKGPKAAFTVSTDKILPGTQVAFYNHTNTLNTKSADNKYTWLYGDGSSTTNQEYRDSVIHSYAAESIDTVILIATNAAEHCADTTSQVVFVRNPDLSFTYTTSFINPDGGCPPVIASFTSTSKNTTRITWNFGDGVTGEGETAGHVYGTPGIYKVTLYGYFIDGTMDSVFEMITIKGPYAHLSAVKPFACGAEPITLKATSSNSRNFTWDFGDGTVISNMDTFATHRYLTPNIYTPSLIVSDGSNCKFAYFPQRPIIIDTLHLTINKQSLVACDSSLLLFTPTTVSLAKDSLNLPITYHWDFGTGKAKDTAGKENTSFIYNTPGKYEIILSGASSFGCTDVTRDSITIQPTPKAFIAGTSQICEDDTAAFTATATRDVTWLWEFGNGNTSSEQNPLPQVYTKPGLDSISLIVNDNGCFDTAWHPLTVHAKPDVNPSPLSAHLCQNDSVQLQAHDGNSYQWTPDYHISGAGTATPYVYPDTDTTYTVTVKNAAGCVSFDSVEITVTERFNVTAPTPLYICPDSSVRLSASGADSYHWLNDGLTNPDISDPVVSVYKPELFTVVGSDRYGCFTDTTTIQVLTATLPTVEAGNNITTYAGTDVMLNATGSADIAKWQWLPSSFIACDTCPKTVLTPHADMQYVLKVTNTSGCVSYDSLQVTILCKAARINVPSAFTPNGDGRNDYFTVLGRGIKEVQHFAVFDRFGNILFERTHLAVTESGFDGWDGTYKGKPMQAGTYVYIADVVCDTGEVFPYKGTVVLIR